MWMRAFSVQPPSEPGVHLSAHRALQRFMPRARPGLRGSSHFLPRSRRTSSTTSASALRIPHGSLIVHRLCPFALWTVISGLQIGRTLPRVGWAARRGPVSHVDAGLFRAASLRTRRARFPGTGLSSDLCRVRDRVCVDPVISCRARGERQVPLRLLHCAFLMVPSSFIACAPSPCGPSLAVSRLDGRYPAD